MAFVKTSSLIAALNWSGNQGVYTTNGIGTISVTLTPTLNTITSVAGTALTLATGTFGTSISIASATGIPTFSTHITVEGVTSTGATGTGNLVFSASPTFSGTTTVATLTATGTVFTFGTANGSNYILTPGTGPSTGVLAMQAGQGSAGFGGGLSMFSATNATYPGWVIAGISTGSGGKFSVNASGWLGGGTNVFTVDSTGATAIFSTTASTSTSTGALIIGNGTSGGLGVGGAGFFGGAITAGGALLQHKFIGGNSATGYASPAAGNGTVLFRPVNQGSGDENTEMGFSNGVGGVFSYLQSYAVSNGGNVFNVNPVGGLTTIGGGSYSQGTLGGFNAAYLQVGGPYGQAGATVTDSGTAASGTRTLVPFTSFLTPTLAATNTGVTTTTASTLYIAGAPVAGTNQTITNTYALQVASGTSFFGGAIIATGNGIFGGSTITYNGVAVGGATTVTQLVKTVGSIADNSATAVLTVTIPNAAHSAMVHVVFTGSLGAGGAIGANEASGTITSDFVVTRTAGVNAVVNASSSYGSATTNVAGGATITVTPGSSAVSGAVGATNTFTVNVTIHAGSGSSTNHTCLVKAEICNANASGITLS